MPGNGQRGVPRDEVFVLVRLAQTGVCHLEVKSGCPPEPPSLDDLAFQLEGFDVVALAGNGGLLLVIGEPKPHRHLENQLSSLKMCGCVPLM